MNRKRLWIWIEPTTWGVPLAISIDSSPEKGRVIFMHILCFVVAIMVGGAGE